MNFNEQYCESMTQTYLDRMGHKYPSGLPIVPLPPSDMTMKDLRIWDSFKQNPYDNNFPSQNWDADLVYVLSGQKPLSLIDNDYFPRDPTEEPIDYFLRFVVTRCGVSSRVMDADNDPTVLYYSKAGSMNALLMLMLHMKVLQAPDQNIMQAQLLGYTFHSTVDYNTEFDLRDVAYRSIPRYQQYMDDNKLGLRDDDGRLVMISPYDRSSDFVFTDEELKQLYGLYYNVYENMIPQVFDVWHETEKIIQNKTQHIRQLLHMKKEDIDVDHALLTYISK